MTSPIASPCGGRWRNMPVNPIFMSSVANAGATTTSTLMMVASKEEPLRACQEHRRDGNSVHGLALSRGLFAAVNIRFRRSADEPAPADQRHGRPALIPGREVRGGQLVHLAAREEDLIDLPRQQNRDLQPAGASRSSPSEAIAPFADRVTVASTGNSFAMSAALSESIAHYTLHRTHSRSVRDARRSGRAQIHDATKELCGESCRARREHTQGPQSMLPI